MLRFYAFTTERCLDMNFGGGGVVTNSHCFDKMLPAFWPSLQHVYARVCSKIIILVKYRTANKGARKQQQLDYIDPWSRSVNILSKTVRSSHHLTLVDFILKASCPNPFEIYMSECLVPDKSVIPGSMKAWKYRTPK